MSKKPTRRDSLDAAMVASWRYHEEGRARDLDRAADGDGARDTGADIDRRIEALQRAGMLKLAQRL